MTISRLTASLFCIGSILLAGCASTDELYAVYDNDICPVHIASATPAKTIIRDRVTAETMVWRPAVYFDFDKSNLKTDAVARLSEDIRVLNRYRELRVAVRGFTDARGSQAYNLVLAKKRVAEVVGYFTDKGIAAQRIDQITLGEKLPLHQGEGEQAMAINRRVELLLLDRNGRALDFALTPHYQAATIRPAAGNIPGSNASIRMTNQIGDRAAPSTAESTPMLSNTKPILGAVKIHAIPAPSNSVPKEPQSAPLTIPSTTPLTKPTRVVQ